ncbi:MAG: hypothetical protein ABJO01_09410 [Parasphingorhabdus sp.]|uniref:hypothetical protein n=1 Tax=Parasphingorhabdus sp. TaxID=2709688 RepID=UPI00329A66F4
MPNYRYLSLFILPFMLSGPVWAADGDLDGPQILALAREAAGGDDWANAQTLMLSGRAVFYGPTGYKPRSIASDYRMWREFDPDRNIAHGADGKVRIIAKNDGKLIFEVGYDGETTWTEKGITPKAQADKFWASNFGFGIIRQAQQPGFVANRLPDDDIGGHAIYKVELVDPTGGKTQFGIDQQSYAIRTMGFRTPKGWHLRVYDDFVRLQKPRWLQSRHVTLYYDGKKSNEVFWEKTTVNQVIAPAIFRSPPP